MGSKGCRWHLRKLPVEEIIALYQQGYSTKMLGDMFKTTPNTIQSRLRENGIALRSPGLGLRVSPRAIEARKRKPWPSNGRFVRNGYIVQKVRQNDFFYPMVDYKGYILEHRLVMARHLNRCLLPWEVVHHKNGVKDDTRLENLELLPHGRFHLIDAKTKSRIAELEKQVILLKAENASLEYQLALQGQEVL